MRFTLSQNVDVFASAAAAEQHIVADRAVSVLAETLLKRGGHRVCILHGGGGNGDRVRLPENASTITVSVRPGSGPPESFRVSVTASPSGGAQAEILGADANGLLYGVGKFLRLLEWRENETRVEEILVSESPGQKVRGWVLSNHLQTNTYDKWELADWDEYLREAALWGVNTLVSYPVHAARWKGVDPWSVPPQFASEERRAEWQRQWAIQKVLPLVARSYGMRFGIWNPVNDLFPMQHAREEPSVPGGLTRNVSRDRGPLLCNHADYLCPSIPPARKLISDLRRHVFSELAHVDFMFLPSGDDGGCSCSDCAPWVNTYLELVCEQAALLHEYHPGAEIWVSNQKLPHEETNVLMDLLVSPQKPPWLTTFCNGPFSGGKEFADVGLQNAAARLRGTACDVVLYPDTTHMTRCQYPIPHVDPDVERVFRREDGPFARPTGYREVFEQTAPFAVGSILYSEGIQDNMNKSLWSQWDWNRDKTSESAVSDHCAWHFGHEALCEIVRLVFLKEQNWSKPLLENAGLDEAVALLEAADAKMPDLFCHDNWRWKMVQIEVYLFQYLRRRAVFGLDEPDAPLRERIMTLRADIKRLCKLDVRGGDRL